VEIGQLIQRKRCTHSVASGSNSPASLLHGEPSASVIISAGRSNAIGKGGKPLAGAAKRSNQSEGKMVTVRFDTGDLREFITLQEAVQFCEEGEANVLEITDAAGRQYVFDWRGTLHEVER
jgi:hypothetical protein